MFSLKFYFKYSSPRSYTIRVKQKMNTNRTDYVCRMISIDRNPDLLINRMRIAAVTRLHPGWRHRDIPAARVIKTSWSRMLIIQKNTCRLMITKRTQSIHPSHIQRLQRRHRTPIGSSDKEIKLFALTTLLSISHSVCSFTSYQV